MGALFIDGIATGWFKGQSGLISKDGFSPNDAGQAYLGIRVAVELEKLRLSGPDNVGANPNGQPRSESRRVGRVPAGD